MNDLGRSEKLPSNESDDELIRELEHWGQRQNSPLICNAIAIQHRAKGISRTRLQMTFVACSIMTCISVVWLTTMRQHNLSPQEIATENIPMASDPTVLLKSFAQRAQDLEFRIEGLTAHLEQQIQVDNEIQNLNASILNYKRIAIRNAIVLNQIP